MPIRRRELLVLVSIWLVGCAVVAGLLAIFMANSTAVPEIDRPRPVATYTVPFTEKTAKTAYLLAQAEAENWQNDAKLMGLSAHWPDATIDGLAQADLWNFRFFSDDRRRIFLAYVIDEEQVDGRAHLYKVRYNPELIDPTHWVIDSDEAVLTWLNYGGGFFLEAFPGSQVEVMLRQTPARTEPIWEIIAVTPDQSNFFYLAIDAATGRIVN